MKNINNFNILSLLNLFETEIVANRAVSTSIQKPAFNEQVLRKWRSLLKLQHF